jgi:hypothetical protein
MIIKHYKNILMAVLLCSAFSVNAANRIWSGATSTTWATGSNWVGGTAPTTNDSVIINSGSSFYPSTTAAITIAKFTINGGSINVNNNAFRSNSSFNVLGGTFTSGSGLITVIASMNMSGGSFVKTSGNLVISGNMNVSGGTTLTSGSGSISITGSLNQSGGTVSKNSGDYNIGDDLNITGGIFNVDYVAVNISDDLLMSGGSVVATSSDFNIDDDMNMSAGTIAGGTSDFRSLSTVVVSGGTFTLGSTLEATTSITFSGATINSGACEIYTDLVTVSAGTVNGSTSNITAINMDITGGTMTMEGNRMFIDDNMVINGGTLNITTVNMEVMDDIYLTTGTLNLNGYAMHVEDEFNYEGGILSNPGNLAIDNLITDFTGTWNLNTNITINESVSFINGIMNTSTSNLLIFDYNSTVSGASNTSHVNGPVRKLVNTSANTNPFDFPVGNGTVYAPLGISNFQSPRVQDYFTAQYFNVSAPFNHTSLDVTLDHISVAEYWTLNRATTSGTATTLVNVRTSFNETNRSGEVDNAGQLRVTQWDGTTWKDLGAAAVTGNNSIGTLRTQNRPTLYGAFTIASTTALNPLPVSLLEFKATPAKNEVLVSWTTTAEINNDFFTVEKSTDGKNWLAIGRIKGVENSALVNNYSFPDQAPVMGTQFYRLIQTDLNGEKSTSAIVHVNFNGNAAATVKVYPNPASSHVSIELGTSMSDVQVVVFNNMGMKVMEMNHVSGAIVNIDLSSFENGLYVFEIHHEEGVSISKIFKH